MVASSGALNSKSLIGKPRLVTVFGGSGFIGGFVLTRLLKNGACVRVVSRNPERVKYAKPAGAVGQLSFSYGNILNDNDVQRALEGADAVVNLVGLLFETRAQRFADVHAKSAARLAQHAQTRGIKHFVHVSALGVDRPSKSRYAHTKAAGEKAVMSAFSRATILRPGLVFGAGDNFFTLFARLMNFSPIVPLIGGGKTRFQPVYAGDVAEAIMRSIFSDEYQGKIFELGCDSVYQFRELLEYIEEVLGLDRNFVTLPFPLARVLAAFTEQLPHPFLTRDQVRLLEVDNVVGKDSLTLRSFGITPTAMESVVPEYLY